MAGIDVKTISLAAAFTNQEIVPVNRMFGAVTFLQFPAGALLSARLGINGQDIPIPGGGVLKGFSPSGDGNNGLYFTNPSAQPGVQVQVMIGYTDADTTPAAEILR
jgi:hypothetical protein